MASRRLEKVAQLLKQELGRIIMHRLHDPRVGFITITRVALSPDLRNARVYVSVLGEEAAQRKTLAGLEHARGHIQSELSRHIDLRRLPLLSFHLDRGVKHSFRVSQILSEVQPPREVHSCQQEPAPETESKR